MSESKLSRYRDAAQRLVRSAWALERIQLLADALLRNGTLRGDDVAPLSVHCEKMLPCKVQ